MAKVLRNIVMQGLSGSLGGQLVFRQSRSGHTIVCSKPSFNPNRTFSVAQQAHQDAFREAAAYAQSAKEDAVYVQKAASLAIRPYNLALADWFHAPELLDIDLNGWNGQVGQIIRVKAMDDVQVTQVMVVIRDGHDVVLEQGAATQVDSLWWEYITTTAVSGNLKVLASAKDLPGHDAEMVKMQII